jgi:hypothetical protein
MAHRAFFQSWDEGGESYGTLHLSPDDRDTYVGAHLAGLARLGPVGAFARPALEPPARWVDIDEATWRRLTHSAGGLRVVMTVGKTTFQVL